jgi:hypothetical protein
MKYLKKFNEEFTFVEPEVKPDVDTPTKPSRPERPSIIPTEKPSVEPGPLAEVEDVVNRVEELYLKMSKDDKKEIDSFFQ